MHQQFHGRRFVPFIPVFCSDCLQDEGLKLTAEAVGRNYSKRCPRCKSKRGKKLDIEGLKTVAYKFFVQGSIRKADYGASPIIQFNKYNKTEWFGSSMKLNHDTDLIAKVLEVGFFYYGPRLWMVGHIEPLEALQSKNERNKVFEQIFQSYPTTILAPEEKFYRIRISPKNPLATHEYDSPPAEFCGSGRFDSADCPVLYGSQNVQICLHECRVTADDNLFIATLFPTRELKLLDLNRVLDEKPPISEFESLDLSLHMLFLAGKHSYGITKALAHAAKANGFDGIIYPSYFSFLQTGHQPFETILGISTRWFAAWSKEEQSIEFERRKLIPNLAIFGRPVTNGDITVENINKIALDRVEYSYHFGPASV